MRDAKKGAKSGGMAVAYRVRDNVALDNYFVVRFGNTSNVQPVGERYRPRVSSATDLRPTCGNR